MINITDLRSTITNYPPVINNTTSTIILKNIKVFKLDGGVYSSVPLPATDFPYIDGSGTRITAMPYPVADNITLRLSPQFFDRMKAQNSKIYIALGFTVNPESTFLNNTEALPGFDTLDGQLTFNNPNTTPFYYDYNPANVTQPYLRDAVVEIAVWSGAVTSSGGGGTTPINGTHTIYASAVSGGTISPVGSISVNDGANQPFSITNNTGYHIFNVLVDGASNGPITSYTFNNVNQDHTIAAVFAIDQYTINPSVIGGNGTISPSTAQTVNYGATPTFTITPNPFYHITDVSVNGISVGTVTSYTFPPVAANYTINASFALGPAPAFTSITPASGPTVGGTPVTIVGTNFVSGGSFGVTIGGVAATSVVWVDSSHITADTPAGTAGAQNVVIINGDGQTATGVGAYTYVAPPTFTSITPNSGTTVGGTPVTIVGTNFVSGGSFGVTIGGVAATSVVWVDSTHITAVTPAGAAGARDVVIINSDGQTATGTNTYTYVTPPPTFTGITPNSGPTAGGTAVTITGTNFVAGGSFNVTVGGAAATSVVWVDSSHITAITPSRAAGAKNIVITNNDGQTATGTNAYTYVATVVIQTYTSSTTWTAPSGVTSVEYLVVGGGGGGGSYGGGGGAGGFRTAAGYAVTPGNTYTVTVGAGGVGGTSNNRGTNGGDSVFSGITSLGGGGGGSSGTNNGRNGGSGGGGERSTGSGGTGTAGQGNNGAAGRGSSPYYGGGGGGASAVGTSGSGTTAGSGGAGTSSSISGVSVTYAGGGGGSATSGTAGSGGSGGGGNGAVGNAAGSNGAANTGGGGGGGGSNPNNGGAGGSGIVIIKYTI
jgi:hypothetical protein